MKLKFILIAAVIILYAPRTLLADDSAPVVVALYKQMLDRDPDDAAYKSWGVGLNNGTMTVKEVVNGLLSSNEYKSRFVTDKPVKDVVDALYVRVLLRHADEEGMNTWTRVLQTEGLGAVVHGIVDSKEYNEKFGDWGIPNHPEIQYALSSAASAGANRNPAMGARAVVQDTVDKLKERQQDWDRFDRAMSHEKQDNKSDGDKSDVDKDVDKNTDRDGSKD